MGRSDPQGERERFERLFKENSRAVLGYALRRTSRPEDAADTVSETMLTAWRRLDSAPAGEAVRFWLLGIARHVLLNQSRSSVRRARLGERLRQEVGAVHSDDFTDHLATRSAVKSALSRLSPSDREVMLLTSWEGLTPREAAIKAQAKTGSLDQDFRQYANTVAAGDGDKQVYDQMMNCIEYP